MNETDQPGPGFLKSIYVQVFPHRAERDNHYGANAMQDNDIAASPPSPAFERDEPRDAFPLRVNGFWEPVMGGIYGAPVNEPLGTHALGAAGAAPRNGPEANNGLYGNGVTAVQVAEYIAVLDEADKRQRQQQQLQRAYNNQLGNWMDNLHGNLYRGVAPNAVVADDIAPRATPAPFPRGVVLDDDEYRRLNTMLRRMEDELANIRTLLADCELED